MKNKVAELSQALREVHKLFLENERVAAEKYLEKSLPPYAFLTMLMQDKNFKWIQPFSALLAEIDAFEDEAEEVTKEDLLRLKKQVEAVLRTPDTMIFDRYRDHLMHDGELMVANARLNQVLNQMVTSP